MTGSRLKTANGRGSTLLAINVIVDLDVGPYLFTLFFFFSLLMFKKEKSNQKHMNWKIPPFSLFNRPFFCFLNEMGEVIFNNNKINSKKKNWKENQTRLLSDIACLFETN